MSEWEAITGIRFQVEKNLRHYLMVDYDRYDRPITAGLEQQRTTVRTCPASSSRQPRNGSRGF